MTTNGRINPETLSAFLEGLPDLLESLRAQGYGLGTRQHVAAHELIGSLFAHGHLPPTFVELDEWLAPLVCYTPAQQEDFRDRYLHWLREKNFAPPPTPPGPKGKSEGEGEGKEATTKKPTKPERFKAWLRAHRRRVYLGGALAAFALALAFYLPSKVCLTSLQPGPCPAPTPQPSPAPSPNPSTEPTPSQTPTPSSSPAPSPTPRRTATPTPEPTPVGGQAWDAEKVDDGKPKVDDLWDVKLKDPPPPPGFWVRDYTTLVVLALAPAFAWLGLWHFIQRRRRRRDAERWGGERPRYDKIKVRGARERVFQSAALRPVARGLRHYLSVESRVLDTRSTVLASVGRGGLFTPVYGRRRTLPEYLVLIDRVGFGDQLAQFNSDIVARLSEHDVYLDAYYFHGDPRRCREGAPDSPQLSLSDLAARHPDHYLLIFSDATGMMSTTTGRPEPFVEQLLFWRGRALLTPVPRLEWDYREWALEREGLKVLPATIDGLRALVDAVNTGARSARPPDFDETPPYPDILTQQPALWKERDEPPPHQTRRLVTHLRRYLGPKGFELLCACAVYPVMQWGVTLFLAYELLTKRELDELLPRLLRLPWFRNATMPQWLRRVLIRELPRARRRLVRERLEHLLLAFLEEPERGLRPRFAEEKVAQPSLLARLDERVEAWRRKRLLRRRLEQAPARSPLAEPVFLNYITNNRRAEALPSTVRRRVFRRGVAAFGLRLAPAAALVAVAVLTGLFLLLLERPADDIYTPGAPDDLLSRLFPRPPAPEQNTDPDFFYTPTTTLRGQSVEFTVRAVTPGEYDLGTMRLAPADSAGRITLKPIDEKSDSPQTDRLAATVSVARDAPLGPTTLNLFDGGRLRASLPVTVVATPTPVPTATPTPARAACPSIKIVANGPPDPQGSIALSVRVSNMPPGSGYLTYFWSVFGGGMIIRGQGMPNVEAIIVNNARAGRGASGVSVVIGGMPLPPGCSATATYTPEVTPSPPTATLKVSVDPTTITVCPGNPKLNEPLNSQVEVRAALTPTDLGASYKAEASGGKVIDRGTTRVNAPIYAWDLSGVQPGVYSVTVSANPSVYLVQGWRYTQSQRVTVRGCDGGEQGTTRLPPAVLNDALKTTYDLKGQVSNMESLKKSLVGTKGLTGDEERTLADALARVRGALNTLDNSLQTLNKKPSGASVGNSDPMLNAAFSAKGPSAASAQSLRAQVNAVFSALAGLDKAVANVKDAKARAQLGTAVNVMRSNASRLNQLLQTNNAPAADE